MSFRLGFPDVHAHARGACHLVHLGPDVSPRGRPTAPLGGDQTRTGILGKIKPWGPLDSPQLNHLK